MATKKATPQPAPIQGFLVGGVSRRTRDLVCDWYEMPEGAQPLKVTVRRLNFEELDALPPFNSSYREIWDAIAGFVCGWNVMAATATSGEVVAVPPPAEAGPDAFRVLEPEYTSWLFYQLKFGHIPKEEVEKKSQPSGSSPGSDDASSSD